MSGENGGFGLACPSGLTAGQLALILAHAPPDAKVALYWDGAARSDVNGVSRSARGEVFLHPSGGVAVAFELEAIDAARGQGGGMERERCRHDVAVTGEDYVGPFRLSTDCPRCRTFAEEVALVFDDGAWREKAEAAAELKRAERRGTEGDDQDTLVAIAAAARALLAEMDAMEPGWRENTLNQGELGDSVNACWDKLVTAVEGAPK